MKSKFSPSLKTLNFFLGLALVMMDSTTQAATPLYHLTDLGTLGGSFVHSTATSISNNGKIAGYSQDTKLNSHAFVYSDGQMKDLGTSGNGRNYSYSFGINDNGQVVGASTGVFQSNPQAFFYDGTTVHTLNTQNPQQSNTFATKINNQGTITGWSSTNFIDGEILLGHDEAFTYANGQMKNLSTFQGSFNQGSFNPGDFNFSRGGSINELNHVAGQSDLPTGAVHAFIHDGQQLKDLGTLGGINSSASGINDLDQATGYSETLDNFSKHAFLYSNGKMQDIGTLGGPNSEGYSINSSAQVVGTSRKINGAQAAFLYSSNSMIDLNNALDGSGSGWTLTEARDINDSGQIVGAGYVNGFQRAFLLTEVAPVPLPGSVLLLGSGLGLFGWLKRRHQPFKGLSFNA